MMTLPALKNILLASDYSDIASYALEHAGALALRDDAALHVLHVQVLLGGETPGTTDNASLQASQIEDALKTLSERSKQHPRGYLAQSAHLGARRTAVIQHVMRDISPASAIVDYTDEHAIDLIVLGSHGRTGISRMLLGSVAEAVIRRSPVSVLVVGDQHQAPDAGYKTIVVPVDFSAHAKAAMLLAKQTMMATDGKFLLVHVIEDVPHPAYFLSREQSIVAAFPSMAEHIRSILRAWADETGLPAHQIDIAIVEGRAHQQITRYAKEHNADLIAMGSTGRGHVHWPLLGGVADKVVRTSPCPVLIAKDLRITEGDGTGAT